MNMIDENKFLDIFPFFRKGSQQLIKDLLSFGKYTVFPDNKIMQFEGELCNSIGLILSGEKRVYKVSEEGREITLYEIGSGEACILNASCILTNTVCPANAISLSKVEELVLPGNVFCELVDKHRELRQFIFNLISQSFASVMELIMEIVFRKMDERLNEYLVEKSENGMLDTTHQKIADDLGTAREVVTRLLNDLEYKGIITKSKHHIQLTSF